jgi:hypothetical protein
MEGAKGGAFGAELPRVPSIFLPTFFYYQLSQAFS